MDEFISMLLSVSKVHDAIAEIPWRQDSFRGNGNWRTAKICVFVEPEKWRSTGAWKRCFMIQELCMRGRERGETKRQPISSHNALEGAGLDCMQHLFHATHAKSGAKQSRILLQQLSLVSGVPLIRKQKNNGGSTWAVYRTTQS